MKMNEQEYKELIAHFEFLQDKAEVCQKDESRKVIERLKKEYRKFVV